MKKKTVKKRAHELLQAMCFWSEDHPCGPLHGMYVARPIKGNRARLLMADEVIDYINGHIRPLSIFPYTREELAFDDNALYWVNCYVGNQLIPNVALIHKML